MTYAQNLSPVLVWRIASLLTRKPDFSDLLNHWGRFRRCHVSPANSFIYANKLLSWMMR